MLFVRKIFKADDGDDMVQFWDNTIKQLWNNTKSDSMFSYSLTDKELRLVVSELVARSAFVFAGFLGIMLIPLISINSDEIFPKTEHKSVLTPDETVEDYGKVIAKSVEMDGRCYYRACDKQCDWYDDDNNRCDGMNKGTWATIVDNNVYNGISRCSKTKGKFAEQGTPSRQSGQYCWCKGESDWVSDLSLENASDCSDNCAGNCAHGVLYSPIFRSALLKTQKQYVK